MRNNYYKNLSFLVVIFILVLTVLVLIAALFLNVETFRVIFSIIALFFILILIVLLTGFLVTNVIISKNDITYEQTKKGGILKTFLVRLSLRVFMPFLLGISSSLKYNKDEIRRVYIRANNEYVLSLNIKVLPGKLLLILPHCLQSSECRYRIREGLFDCHQCNNCNLGRIKELIKKYGVKVQLATGGTTARKAVKDLKPDFVIAVACERDLSSGIMDVKGLPIYGILNQRPNGPCKDTFVDTEEIEKMIEYFTKD